MLTLYVKTGCPFCAKVHRAGEELQLTFDEKNIADPGVAQELIQRGGKQMVPYLVDSETGTEMYESDDIVKYLHEHYGNAHVESGKIDEHTESAHNDGV